MVRGDTRRSSTRAVGNGSTASVSWKRMGDGFPSFRVATTQALEFRSHAVRTQDRVSEVRGWKLFCLLPVMLLRRESGGSKVSKQELCRRFDLFVEGNWESCTKRLRSLRDRRTDGLCGLSQGPGGRGDPVHGNVRQKRPWHQAQTKR